MVCSSPSVPNPQISTGRQHSVRTLSRYVLYKTKQKNNYTNYKYVSHRNHATYKQNLTNKFSYSIQSK